MIRNVHTIHGFKFVEPDAARAVFEAFVLGSSDYDDARRRRRSPRAFVLVDPRPLLGHPPADSR